MLRNLLLTLTGLFCLAQTAGRAGESFEDPVLPLEPRAERSEDQSLRVASRAWYGQARLMLRRKDYPGALRGYQRAWRYNPQAREILPRVVILAAQLRRPEVAGRYLERVEDLSSINPALLRQLALQLSARGRWEQASRLFEHTLPAGRAEAGDAPEQDLASLLLHFEMGRLYFLTEDYPRAADSFADVRRALDQPELLDKNAPLKQLLLEEPPRTYRMLAESFFRAGRWKDAASMFRRALDPPTPDGQWELQQARIAAGQEQTDKASRLLEKALAKGLDGAGTEPYRLLAALIDEEHEDPGEARTKLFARLEELTAADGSNLALRSFAADAYLRADRLEDAERHLEAIQVLDASGEVLERLVDVYRRTENFEQLLETCELALVRGGSLDAVRSGLAPGLEDAELLGELLERTASPAEHAPDSAPSTGRQIAAAWLALLGDRPEAALERFDRAVRTAAPEDPLVADPRLWLNWGLDCLGGGRYEAAASALARAVEQAEDDPQKAAALFYRSRALALDGRIEPALDAAREAGRLQPDAPRIRSAPGWVLFFGKRYDEAIESYEQLLEAFDDNHTSAEIRDVMRDARLVLSNLALLLGDRPQAEEWLEQVLDEFPGDIGALNDLGYLWIEDQKYLNRALEMVQTAVEAEPDNAAYRDSLGWAYYQLGRFSEAVVQLEKAAEGEDPDGVILDHLGDAYRRLDRKDEALDAWQRAVEAFTDEEDAARRRATQTKIRRHRAAGRSGD